MTIVPIARADYLRLVEIWEASVRATHDFLTEADLQVMKPLILNGYLDAVDLAGVCDDSGELVGFLGTHENRIEMLFVAPEMRGKGFGRMLIEHAVDRLGCDEVDVNEQNPQAVGFYLKLGFRQVGRSARDGQGNPFPLLHLKLPVEA
ncbi:GNAT family N-acetyltransferase [Paludisphaera rhizosphaerae]|uniref:GNAT family N-acetyltransferase n=1 Tax=Paludisphaera rhizosphaerae TaxID=2711216 RepID=UPI0013EAC52E|nr:GNAT family N-acetyltransferase [Paludisphaera rhizosphaerae]